MVYYRMLNIVPLAIQMYLVVYLFYVQWFVFVNPKLPIYPSSTPCLFWKLLSLFSISVSLSLFCN